MKTSIIVIITLFTCQFIKAQNNFDASIKENSLALASNLSQQSRQSSTENFIFQSLKEDGGSKVDFPRYSHFSINTGLGKSFRRNDFTSYKAPIMIFVEKGGNLGKLTEFIDIPNWIFTGAYLRYSKQEISYYNYYSYSAFNLGLGVRSSVALFPMIASISGKEMKKTGPLDVYAGLQIGYDYVGYDGYLSYYGYYGAQSGLKVAPFAGARLNLLKWFGVHAELGSTSGRWMTLGVNFRKQH